MFDYFAKKKAVILEAIGEDIEHVSQHQQEDPILLKLNYSYKPSPIVKVKISYDFKTAVFTDMNEKFIVEQKDGYTVQRKLNVLTGKIVHYIF